MAVRFLPESLVLLMHEDQIRAFGGMQGIRDIELMRSALGQAICVFMYGAIPKDQEPKCRQAGWRRTLMDN